MAIITGTSSSDVISTVSVSPGVLGGVATNGGDSILAGGGTDSVRAGDGADSLFGDGGGDTLDGEAGNDLLEGGEEADLLLGGAGADTLTGGLGWDTMTGGADADVFVLTASPSATKRDTVTDFVLGLDRLDVSKLGIASFAVLLANLQQDGADLLLALSRGSWTSEYRLTGVDIVDLQASDILFATATTADTLAGTTGRDDIFGGLGHDIITAGSGNDRLFGEQGNDRLSGDAFDDLLDGGDGNDMLLGGEDSDTLLGGSGADTLDGGLGWDTMTGGAGADVFRLTYTPTGTQNDRITDFSVTEDRLDVSGFGIATLEALRQAILPGLAGEVLFEFTRGGWDTQVRLDNLSIGQLTATQVIFSTDTVSGAVVGSNSEDHLFGGLGNDTLAGGNGADRLFGETGDDSLAGDAATDLLDGGTGNDVLAGGLDSDTLRGGEGADTLDGGADSDILVGGAGADLFRFGFIINTNQADRILDFALAQDRIDLSSFGVSTLASVQQLMQVTASGGTLITFRRAGYENELEIQDVLPHMLTAAHFVFGNGGLANGTSGEDDLFGGSARSLLVGGRGDDRLFGERGHDVLDGDEGRDLLDGGANSDLLRGGADADTLVGGSGTDTLDGGIGNDRLLGGADADVFRLTYVAGESQSDVVLDFVQGQDRLDLSSFGISTMEALQQVIQEGPGGGALFRHVRSNFVTEIRLEGIAAGALTAADIIFAAVNAADVAAAGGGTDMMFGGHGMDVLWGGFGEDSLFGEQGNDSLSGESGNDLLDGGHGNDTLLGGDGRDLLRGGIGNDAIEGEEGDDRLEGGDGTDRLSGGAGSNVLDGGNGLDWADYTIFSTAVAVRLWQGLAFTGSTTRDTLTGIENLLGGAANDTLEGDALANRIEGAGGDDRLLGGAGNDTLTGGAGFDALRGGVGADRFVFIAISDAPVDAVLRDSIQDFVSGTDLLDLAAIDAVASVAGDQAFTFIGAAAFSAAGQLRRSGDDLLGEVTGDGVADFAVRLQPGAVFTALDLIG